MNRCESKHVLPLISFCLSFCKPIAYRFVSSNQQTSNNDDLVEDEQNFFDSEDNDLDDTIHSYLLAELEFLRTVLNKYSSTLMAQSAIVVGLLSDFFQRV